MGRMAFLGLFLFAFGWCCEGSLTTHMRERDIILEMRSLIRNSLDRIERNPSSYSQQPVKERNAVIERDKEKEEEEEDCYDINAHRFRFVNHDNVVRFRKTMGYRSLVGLYKCKTRKNKVRVIMTEKRGDTTTVHDSHDKYDHMATPLTVIFFIVFVPGLTVIIILAMIGLLLLLSLRNKLLSNMK